MLHRMGAAAAAIVATLVVAVGAGPAAAGPAEAPASTPTGWVVDNPSANGVYETNEGSATVVLATGAAVSCPVVSGWGRADSGTLRPQDVFGETGATHYGGGGCTGPGGASVDIGSSPGMVFAPESYDAETDVVTGSALPWVWGMFMDWADCQIDMYPLDSNAPAPLTYDNRTGTLDLGPVAVEVTRAAGPGCVGLAQVGDHMTFQTTVVATPRFTVRPA